MGESGPCIFYQNIGYGMMRHRNFINYSESHKIRWKETMSPSKKIMSSIVYMFTISKRFPSSINLHFLGFLPISKTTNLPSRLLQLSPQKMSPSTMQRYPSENNDHYIPIYDTLMIFSYLYLSRFDFIMLIALFYYPNHRSYYR